MYIAHARELARQWVDQVGRNVPGYQGAWIAGSTTTMPDREVLPPTSDLDIMVVLSNVDVSDKRGKFRYHAVLLEVTYISRDEIRSPEHVLGHYHLAGSVRNGLLLDDPSGLLTALQADVVRDFASRVWGARRSEMARDVVLSRLDAVVEGLPFEQQVMSWLFATGGLPHVLLVAGLRNPTVRKRYVAARELLDSYGEHELYAALIDLLDPVSVSPERLSHHVDVLEKAFDAASTVVRTPFPFAADISTEARAVAIDGSRELIAKGDHREAIFWIVATFARCQIILHADAATEIAGTWDVEFLDLMADLGIRSFADLRMRGEAVRHMLPRVWSVSESIIDHVLAP